MIRVYHNPNFLDYTISHPTPAKIMRDYRESKIVAIVPGDSLDNAFTQTNNINQLWTKNPLITVLVPEARSTSAGDFMRRGNEIFLIEAIGFRKIKG